MTHPPVVVNVHLCIGLVQNKIKIDHRTSIYVID